MQQLAYAKLNLTLAITGRRADGYHQLDSIFHTIDLHDTLSLTSAEQGITLSCTPCVLQTDDNLVLRAARAFFSQVPCKQGVHFSLVKSIPTQAGLGGGSADAAAALKLLNHVYGQPLCAQQLAWMGLSLGADVPFALAGGTQRVTGIGEHLSPVSLSAPYYFVLIQPEQGLSTKQIYALYDQNPSGVHPRNDAFIHALQARDCAALRSLGGNALQRAAEQLCPTIATIEQAFYAQGAALSGMTGSGSVVFGLFEQVHQALQAYRALRVQWPTCLYARSLLPAAT